METSNKDILASIQVKYSISEPNFIKGIEYCEHLLNGVAKHKAYADTYEVDLRSAAIATHALHREKWIQDILLALRPEADTLYFSEVRRIIQVAMGIIDDPGAKDRDKIDAMKALTPYVKAESKDMEVTHKVETAGASLSSQITQNIKMLADSGKMISQDGSIIDVELIA